jgi:excisionase family DNA binding protein
LTQRLTNRRFSLGNLSYMVTEILPQRADYQKAIYESLCRIEQLLRTKETPIPSTPKEPPVPSAAFSGALTMDETAKALRVSRSTVKELIGRGVIRVVRLGRRVLIPTESLDRLLNEAH